MVVKIKDRNGNDVKAGHKLACVGDCRPSAVVLRITKELIFLQFLGANRRKFDMSHVAFLRGTAWVRLMPVRPNRKRAGKSR